MTRLLHYLEIPYRIEGSNYTLWRLGSRDETERPYALWSPANTILINNQPFGPSKVWMMRYQTPHTMGSAHTEQEAVVVIMSLGWRYTKLDEVPDLAEAVRAGTARRRFKI